MFGRGCCVPLLPVLLLLLALTVLFGPFLRCFTFPLTHHQVSTPHPASPHSPPASVILTQQEKEMFREEGVLVLRNVMPPDIMEALAKGSEDIVTNRTVHCDMARFNGAPIFHSYSLLCHFPDLVHDTFRDALLHSPLSHVASQLMGNSPVRIFNTFSMGAEEDQVVPLRWHADFPVFSGKADCHNGIVSWMPVKVSHPHLTGRLSSNMNVLKC